MTAPSVWELAARKFEKTAPEFDSPMSLAQTLDSRVVTTPALDLINQKLVETYNKPDGRLIVSLAPQEGKSQLCSRRFPTWALHQNPDLRVAVASYEANIARRWGRAVRDDITQHYQRLGLSVRSDLSSQTEWQLVNHEGGMFTAGVGGAMTGRPVDLLLIDDPVKGREQADSEAFQERTWEWWTDVALTRLSPGASVVLVLTRWSEKDLAGKILEQDPENWEVLNFPTQADHRPELGETDILGRQPGEYLISARGRTNAQWEARKRASGPSTWASLYQGRPGPTEGGVFPRDLPTYSTPVWIERPDGSRVVPGMGRPDQELAQSWDMTFKDTKGSDYVVGQVWLRVGSDVYLLDQVRGRMDFNRTLRAVQELSARWPEASAKYVEDKANGTAVINSLSRTIPGLIPVEPEGGKISRAHAVAPFIHSGNVHLPAAELLPSVQDLRNEMLNFPRGSHDDTVDAMTQAVNQLLLRPIYTGGGSIDDFFDDVDDTPLISAY